MKSRSLGFALASLFLCTAPPGHAAEQALGWSTYVRSGPGYNYAVLDELYEDTVVDVRSCAGQWCEIISGGKPGYIDRDSLTLYVPSPGDTPIGGPQGCFYAPQYSWRSPEMTRFCQTQPSRIPASKIQPGQAEAIK